MAGGHRRGALHPPGAYSLAWAPDSRRLASASNDGTVRVWDALSGTQTEVCKGHESQVRSVTWSPDGRWLLSGAMDGIVKMWSPVDGSAALTLMQHTAEIKAVA